MTLRTLAFGLALSSAVALMPLSAFAGAQGKHGGGGAKAAAGAKRAVGAKGAGAAGGGSSFAAAKGAGNGSGLKQMTGSSHVAADKKQMHQDRQQIHSAQKDLQKNMQAIRGQQQALKQDRKDLHSKQKDLQSDLKSPRQQQAKLAGASAKTGGMNPVVRGAKAGGVR